MIVFLDNVITFINMLIVYNIHLYININYYCLFFDNNGSII